MDMKKRILAFTLAEVLITLAIIGVVAALTIPTVVAKYEKRQTVARLQNITSVLNNAITASVARNGATNTWDKSLSVKDFSELYLVPFLKVDVNCGIESNSNKRCFPIVQYKNPFGKTNANQQLSGTNKYRSDYNPKDDPYRFKLTSGESIMVEDVNKFNYARLWVDLNGTKEPNTYGKDAFQFILYFDGSDLILPNTDYAGVCVKNSHLKDNPSTFYGCGGKIMKDGWRIADDYPW